DLLDETTKFLKMTNVLLFTNIIVFFLFVEHYLGASIFRTTKVEDNLITRTTEYSHQCMVHEDRNFQIPWPNTFFLSIHISFFFGNGNIGENRIGHAHIYEEIAKTSNTRAIESKRYRSGDNKMKKGGEKGDNKKEADLLWYALYSVLAVITRSSDTDEYRSLDDMGGNNISQFKCYRNQISVFESIVSSRFRRV
ncbi:hypothetical protein ACJX0J_026237, partial [Zea mays]